METLPSYNKEELNKTVKEIYRFLYHQLRTYSGSLHDAETVKHINNSIDVKLKTLLNTGKLSDFAYRSFADHDDPLIEVAFKMESDGEWDIITVGP